MLCSHSPRFREVLLQSLCHCWYWSYEALHGRQQVLNSGNDYKSLQICTAQTERPLGPKSGRARHGDALGCMLFAFLWFSACEQSYSIVPFVTTIESSVHLTVSEVAVNSLSNPSLMRVRLMQSKMDPFRQGVDIYLGRTSTTKCPITAMLVYLARRDREAGPLFLCSDGMPLSICNDLSKKCG